MLKRTPLYTTAILSPFGFLPQFPANLYMPANADQDIACWLLPLPGIRSTIGIGFAVIETTTHERSMIYSLVAVDLEAEGDSPCMIEIKGQYFPVLFGQFLDFEIQDAMNKAQDILKPFQLQSH